MFKEIFSKLTGLKHSEILRTTNPNGGFSYHMDVWGYRPSDKGERGDKKINQIRFTASGVDELSNKIKKEFNYAV